MIYFSSSRRVPAARKHLDLAFGDSLNRKEKNTLIKKSLEHFVWMFFDFFRTAFWKKEDYLKQIKVSENSLRHWKDAWEQNQGLLLLSAHLGNWEVALSWFSIKMENSLFVVVKNLKPPFLDRFIVSQRQKFGTKIIRKNEAARGVLKALKNKDAVAILMDQNRPDGLFVPFFGRLAGTSALVPTLAMRTGALVLPLYCLWRKDHYELIIEKAISFEEGDKRQENIEKGTRKCNEILEKMILSCPEQWLWTHLRYKSLAEGQAPLYNKKHVS
jgi:KDO2-lipid IV(A) lauroyltransferase